MRTESQNFGNAFLYSIVERISKHTYAPYGTDINQPFVVLQLAIFAALQFLLYGGITDTKTEIK